MSQDKATKTDKAQDGIIGKIAKAIERIGDHRTALGKLMRDARALGLTYQAIIKRVTATLPRDPSLYLGMAFNTNAIKVLIARADAIDRNARGFIHGNNVVTEEQLATLKLGTQDESDLMVALDAGLHGDNGVSVAAAKSAVAAVARHGADSDEGKAAIAKLKDAVTRYQRYEGAEEGSLLEAERIMLRAEENYLRAQKAAARAKKAWDEAKAAHAALKRAESTAIAKANAEAAPEPAPAKRRGEGKGRRREAIQAASAS